MHKIIIAGILVVISSGCVFADVAKLEAYVVDEKTGEPLANAEVVGGFEMNYGWLAVKGAPGPNTCRALTDSRGRCKLSGETNVGDAGCWDIWGDTTMTFAFSV